LKTSEQRAARHLRGVHGRTLNELAATLEVAKSSVSLWVRHVELMPEAQARINSRQGLGTLVSGKRSAERARHVRRGYQREGRERARREDGAYQAGCMLYWAEGAKCRNSVQITNSDPEVLVYFVAFLRKYFGVASNKVRIACHLFADHLEKQHEIEEFWLERLELSGLSLRKSQVNVYSKYSQKKRDGKLPYGTCKLVVDSTQIVQTIYGSIQEYGGFERPAWLD
jgi:hypothetical protein